MLYLLKLENSWRINLRLNYIKMKQRLLTLEATLLTEEALASLTLLGGTLSLD